MDRDDVKWRGYWVAMPTPFTATGEVDEAALRALIDQYVSSGVHGILVNGTTGEWFSQSDDERRTVAEVATTHAGGRVPVVVGCSSYTPSQTISLAQHAQRVGAAGVCTTPPPYVHPTPSEIFRFYQTVTEAVALPWMVYNWPRGAAVDIQVDLMRELSDLPNVVAIKESSPDEVKCAEGCEAVVARVRFFARFIHRRGMAILREIGGDGNIDGGGLGATFAVPYFDALWRGEIEEARLWGRKYSTLTNLLVLSDYSGRWGSPTAQLKAAMRILGQPGGFVRAPLVDLGEETALGELRQALVAGGLMVEQASEEGGPAVRRGGTTVEGQC
ncbi:MAG: dihydrodipicolinate synthase family protein [Candidatus Dormibacteria bacterium]